MFRTRFVVMMAFALGCSPTPRRARYVAPPTALVEPAPLPAPTAPTAPPRRLYDHVVIVSFDGMRPDAMAQADAPALHRLAAAGASAQNARTIDMSSTLPAHSSMLTGVDVDVHGMDFDEHRPERGFVRAPTIFQEARRAGFASAMFVSKSKLRHIALPQSLDVYAQPSHQCGGVAREAARYLNTAPAGITFVHFGEPDVAGHHRGWMGPEYLTGIARADRCLDVVLRGIASRTDRTLLIVSADHGGHGFHHGTLDPRDLQIPWIAVGPSVRPGPFATPVRTTDTAATALRALLIPPPAGIVGRPVEEVLDASVIASPSATPAAAPEVVPTRRHRPRRAPRDRR